MATEAKRLARLERGHDRLATKAESANPVTPLTSWFTGLILLVVFNFLRILMRFLNALLGQAQ